MGTGADWPAGAIAHQIAVAIGPRLCASGMLLIVSDPEAYVLGVDGAWTTITLPANGGVSADSVAVKNKVGYVSWTGGDYFTTSPLPDLDISTVEMPSPPDDAYSHDRDADGRLWITTFSWGAIYYSDDQGVTWAESFTPPPAPQFWEVTTHPTDPARIAVVASDNFGHTVAYITIDGGSSWLTHTIRVFDQPHFGWESVIVWLKTDRLVWLGFTSEGALDEVYSSYSDDDGVTWSTAALEVPTPDPTDSRLLITDIRATSEGYVFAIVNFQDNDAGPDYCLAILRSVDGATWEVLNPHSATKAMALAYDENTDDLYISYLTDKVFKIHNANTIPAAEWVTEAVEVADVPAGAVGFSPTANMVVLNDTATI